MFINETFEISCCWCSFGEIAVLFVFAYWNQRVHWNLFDLTPLSRHNKVDALAGMVKLQNNIYIYLYIQKIKTKSLPFSEIHRSFTAKYEQFIWYCCLLARQYFRIDLTSAICMFCLLLPTALRVYVAFNYFWLDIR